MKHSPDPDYRVVDGNSQTAPQRVGDQDVLRTIGYLDIRDSNNMIHYVSLRSSQSVLYVNGRLHVPKMVPQSGQAF